MQIVLKIITGIVLGAAGCCAWLLGVLGAIASFNGFMNVIHGMHSFSRSRGSIFDVMALQASSRNPLRNAGVDMDTALIILGVIALLTIITMLRAGITSNLREMLGRGFIILAGGVMLCSLSFAAMKWLSQQPWMMTLFVGVVVGYGINFLARWLLNGTEQKPVPIQVDTE